MVVDILSQSFDTNPSVNYVVKPGDGRPARIRGLMAYSFDVCHAFGKVYLSNDRKACALVLLPDKKKTTLKSILWDLKLAFTVIGPTRVPAILARESIIKSGYPREPIYHLWYLGVDPAYQRQGIGQALLGELISESVHLHRPVYLETSVTENVAYYERAGFKLYKTHAFGNPPVGHTSYCMNRAWH